MELPAYTVFIVTRSGCRYSRVYCFLSTAFDCGRLPSPDNGRVVHRGTTAGSVATYTCNPGHTLQGGNEFRQCFDGVGWSGSAPTCEGN